MTDLELEKKIDDLLDGAIARAQKKRRYIEGALLLGVIILIVVQFI